MLQILIEKINNAIRDNLPLVAYKSSDNEQVTLLVQKDKHLHYQSDYYESGFVFAPFDNRKSSIIFRTKDCEMFKVDCDVKKLDKLISKGNKNENIEPFCLDKNARLEHISLVKKGLHFLSANNASKVVLSRKEEVEVDGINLINIFLKLLQKYPTAFVYLWFHPKVGLWLGATPETLLRVKDNKFKTMALAGTKNYLGNLNVTWEEKEKQEQQIVTDFIKSQLKDVNIKVGETFSLKAGSLLHICTEISGEISEKNNLERLVKVLHPTPAVCGLPKELAKNFILEKEAYHRDYYTGFLGEININKETNLFVNLRCMQITFVNAENKGSKAILYVGGGITKESKPESEWLETVAKSKVMKRVLS